MPSPQGPNSAGTGADDGHIGSLTWSNPGNITSSDNTYATCPGDSISATQSHYLVATNFGFSIPAGATIDGIVVEWERYDGNVPGEAVADNSVMIAQGGLIGTGSNLSTGALWATSDQYDSFGSSTELWGLSWTVADINASDFGASLAPDVNAFAVASVDHCRITVYYTEAVVYPIQGVRSRSLRKSQSKSATLAITAPNVMVTPVPETWSIKAKSTPLAKMPAPGAKTFHPDGLPPDAVIPFGWTDSKTIRPRRLQPWPANRSTFALPLEQTPPFPDAWLTRSVGDKRSRPRLNRSWFVLPTERTPPNPDSWLTRIIGPTPRRAFAGRSVSLFQLVPYANDPISPWFNNRRVVVPKPLAGRTTISQVSAQEVLPFGLPIPFVRAAGAKQPQFPGRPIIFTAGQPLITPLPGVTITKPIQRLRRGSNWFALTGAGEETDLGSVSFISSGRTLPRKFVPSSIITRILEATGTGILTLGFLKPLVCRPVIRLGQRPGVTHIMWTPRDIATTLRLDNRNAGGGARYGQSSSGIGNRNQSSTGNT